MVEVYFAPWEGFEIKKRGRVVICESLQEAAELLIAADVDDVEAALQEAREEWAES